MALVELAVQRVGVSASTSTIRMYMRCQRRSDPAPPPPAAAAAPASSHSKQSRTTTWSETFLHLELAHGARLWRADVHGHERPDALDCTSAEYLCALERAFTPPSSELNANDSGNGTCDAPRFQYKWAMTQSTPTGTATLTLMEHAQFAMKYTTLAFAEVTQDDHDEEGELTKGWQDVLQEVVAQQQDASTETMALRQRVATLERELAAKDDVLERALRAKQEVEGALLTQFCSVLNAKKEEIARLQRTVRGSSEEERGHNRKRKLRAEPASRGRKRKPVGARLAASAAEEEEEEEEKEEGDEESDQREEEEEEEKEREEDRARRIKREAVAAYSEAPTAHVCSAAVDVLSDLDALMAHEVAADEDVSRGGGDGDRHARRRSNRAADVDDEKKKDPVRKEKKSSTRNSKSSSSRTGKTKAPAPAPGPKAAMDSEEEDILDMLA